MKITGLDLYHIRLPLKSPFEISRGRLTHIDSILVRLASGAAEGWGEAPPWNAPIYGPETADTAFYMVREIFSPMIVGQTFDTPEEINAVLKQFRGNYFAKAAVETAWWVLDSMMKSLPLHVRLGGTKDRTVNCGVSLGISDTPDQLLSEIEESLGLGYQRVKIKVKHGWDVNILEAVRRRFPSIPLQVDANGTYTLDDLETLKRFDDYNLVQIEQPLSFDDLVDHAFLQRQLKTPICLDESIKTPDDARKAIQLGSCRIINIKLTRVGGIWEGKRIHDICARGNVPCWVGGMLESAIGEAICIEFATLPNITMPSDTVPGDRFYTSDTTTEPTRMSRRGTFQPSRRPGFGYGVDLEKIKSFTVNHWSSTP